MLASPWPLSRNARRNLRLWRRRGWVLLWVLASCCSYALVWSILVNDHDQSYSEILQRHQYVVVQQQGQNQQAPEEKSQKQSEDQKRLVEAPPVRLSRRSHLRATITDSSSHGDEGTDWVFWIMSAFFVLLSYYRIQSEDSRLQRYEQRPHSRNRFLGQARTTQQERQRQQHQALQRTLRRINQEREALDQTPISFDAVQALQQALLQDRSLWRALATGQTANNPEEVSMSMVGATQEQLEACPAVVYFCQEGDGEDVNDDSRDESDINDLHAKSVGRSHYSRGETDCSICLIGYQPDDMVRNLPCGHSFHADCIDRWFKMSIMCPICKTPLVSGANGEDG